MIEVEVRRQVWTDSQMDKLPQCLPRNVVMIKLHNTYKALSTVLSVVSKHETGLQMEMRIG